MKEIFLSIFFKIFKFTVKERKQIEWNESSVYIILTFISMLINMKNKINQFKSKNFQINKQLCTLIV